MRFRWLTVVMLAGVLRAQDDRLVVGPAMMPPSGLPRLDAATAARMDKDLLEVDVPRLHALYEAHTYTVEQVTRWYLDRIARFNGVYLAVQTVDVEGALARARAEDKGEGVRGALWGVPIVIKANTAVKGLPDTDGWSGFVVKGHEFVAGKDATVVAKLRAAGAVILGITNMPDFAASDTNRSSALGRTGNAYDARYSPGGSSGGTVTAVTGNFALLGTGTDTANSIRMPAGTSAVVGMLPTRGLVSVAGIAPLDWLRDNTGPIARDVTDAAIALDVMRGEDAADFRTEDEGGRLEPASFTTYLKKDALKGKRFGVPAFIFTEREDGLRDETRAMLMRAIDELKAAGAEVVIADDLLPLSFMNEARGYNTRLYLKDGADRWLAAYGPAEYKTGEAYTKATGIAWPEVFTGQRHPNGVAKSEPQPQLMLGADKAADAQNLWGPREASLKVFDETLKRYRLDGYVYPSAQMAPMDETMPQDGQLSSGPHSATGFVNRLGVPAVVVPAGFYASGMPFGLEITTRRWHDGELLGWAYAFEQATHDRRPPVLMEKGMVGAR